ncbi:MAG: rRNA (uracil1939-C5)-methyltransferase [Gaiellales bacterium]|jgi:23S rRNA (uracil1939-C5)-methyltransferase|nr:rRNA (uracil1939-C5)-methyltransferase [Gaiellales bacterium]
MPTLTRNQELELTIDSLAYGGRGVARHGDLVVFVARALPGDRVRARVTKFKRRYAEARMVELLTPGPGRVAAPCSHFGVCGGCAWQDLDYSEQLRHKQAQVTDALERLGKLEGYQLEPIEPAREIWGYRNKLEYSWSQTEQGPSLGFHVAGRWDRLMAVELCHITSEKGNELRRAFERWARTEGLRAYDQRTGEGFLRHLVMREGRRTGQMLAQLVTAPGELPGIDSLARELPDGVVGVVHSVNDGVAEVTSGLAGRAVIGVDEFEEEILGLSLRLSAGAFMQTNTEMSDVLYGHAIDYADLVPDDVAWDLYCGVGAIGLIAARHVRKVVGIEISEESIARAHETAERNGITNAEFVLGDVAKELRPLLERVERPSVVFVDPPRAGLTPRAVRRLIELAPERIVYVSCNPTTLAPNGRQLVDAGYTLERVRAVDMFPHTHHIECVARFTRGTAPPAA